MEVYESIENDVDYNLYSRRRLRMSHEPIAIDLSRHPRRAMAVPLDQKHLRNWMLSRDRVRAEPRIRHYAAWGRPTEHFHLARMGLRRR